MAFKYVPPPKNVFDYNKFILSSAYEVEGQKVYAGLYYNVVGNNPRFTVFTNHPNEKGVESANNGKIDAKLDAIVFEMFVEDFTDIIKNQPNDTKRSMVNKNHTWYGGTKSAEPEVESTLAYGKDKNGIIWISVLAAKPNRPKIKFNFMPSFYHELIDSNGNKLPNSEVSKLYSLSWLKNISDMTRMFMTNNYKHPEKKDPKGGSSDTGKNKVSAQTVSSNEYVEDILI